MVLADIASGKTGAADILFLLGIILAFLGVLASLVSAAAEYKPHVLMLVAAAVGCTAFGLLLL